MSYSLIVRPVTEEEEEDTSLLISEETYKLEIIDVSPSAGRGMFNSKMNETLLN